MGAEGVSDGDEEEEGINDSSSWRDGGEDGVGDGEGVADGGGGEDGMASVVSGVEDDMMDIEWLQRLEVPVPRRAT